MATAKLHFRRLLKQPTRSQRKMTPPLLLPIRTKNPLNGQQGVWQAKARKRKQERETTYLLCGSHWTVWGWPKLPVTVLLTRIAPRAMDTDGLAASFKSIRDGIADRLGIDDGGKQVAWEYAQRRGKPKEYAVEIIVKEQVCQSPTSTPT